MILSLGLLIPSTIKFTNLILFFLFNIYWISTANLLYKASYICIITIRLVNAENVILLPLAGEKSYESPDFLAVSWERIYTRYVYSRESLHSGFTNINMALAWFGNQEMQRRSTATVL